MTAKTLSACSFPHHLLSLQQASIRFCSFAFFCVGVEQRRLLFLTFDI